MTQPIAPIRDFEMIAAILRDLDGIEAKIPESVSDDMKPVGSGMVESFENMILAAGKRLKADRGQWVIDQLIRDFAAKDEAQGRRLSRIWKDIGGAA